MSKNKFLLLLLIFSNFSLQAQYSRLSIEAYTGTPLSLTFFTPTLSPFGGFGVKYSLLKELSIAGHIDIGTLAGKNFSANNTYTGSNSINNYLMYTNNFVQYTLEGQLNLERVFGLRRFLHRLNPFLVVGGGIIRSDESATKVDGMGQRAYPTLNFYTAYMGLNFKYYLNPSLDLMFGSNFYASQTKYLDAVPIDGKLDNYLLNYIGISYKVGARKDKQNIDWNNVILKDRIYIPDIEKHIGQPIDEAGNFFIFHKDSIAKLQASNVELQNKTAQLETKSTELESKNVSQQKQIDSLQNQVVAINKKIDTMSNQKVSEKIAEKVVEKVVVDTSKISSPSERKIIAKLETENNELRNKNIKLEQKVTEQQKQIDNMQNQLNQIKKQMEEKPQIKYTIPPAENPANNNIVPPSDNKVESSKIKTESHKKAKVESNNNVIPSNTLSEGLNKIDNVSAPIAKYNVIAGAYAGEKYAYIFRDKLRAKGFEAAVFKSDVNSRIFRVCVFSSQDKQEAINMMKKVRTDIDPQAWVHVYHQK